MIAPASSILKEERHLARRDRIDLAIQLKTECLVVNPELDQHGHRCLIDSYSVDVFDQTICHCRIPFALDDIRFSTNEKNLEIVEVAGC